MSFSKFPSFQKFSLTDAADYLKYYIHLSDAYCDFSLDDLSIWLNYNDDLAMCELNGNLIIRFTNILDKNQTYYTLLGQSNLDSTLKNLAIYSEQQREPVKLSYIPQQTMDAIRHTGFRGIAFEEDTDNFDYVYSVEDLIAMHGKPYENFRRRVNHFKRENSNVQTIQFDLSSSVDREIIENNVTDWSVASGFRNDPQHWELKVIKKHLELANDLPVYAYGLLSDDKLINVNVFNLPPQKDWLIFNHIKCDYSYPDVYGYAFYNLFLIAQSRGIKWVNFEQDLGIEGLRRIKTFFRPAKMLKRYTVTFDGDSSHQ